MRNLELLDIISIISLVYQIDSNQQLREQSTNDDILKEISDFAEKLTNQNDRIIQLLEVLLCIKQEKLTTKCIIKR